MDNNTPHQDDDFMAEATPTEKGSGKWLPKRGRPKKREDIHTVNVDFSLEMLEDIDKLATLLNVSRQAVIKNFCLSGINQNINHLEHKKKSA